MWFVFGAAVFLMFMPRIVRQFIGLCALYMIFAGFILIVNGIPT